MARPRMKLPAYDRHKLTRLNDRVESARVELYRHIEGLLEDGDYLTEVARTLGIPKQTLWNRLEAWRKEQT